MNSLWTRLIAKISASISTSEISSVRIQSYIILLPIILMSIVFVIIEVWSFIHAIYNDKSYVLSNEIIVVFGMILSHHLAILFSRSKTTGMDEIKTNIDDIKSAITNNNNSGSTTQIIQENQSVDAGANKTKTTITLDKNTTDKKQNPDENITEGI